jgi:pathogenesis-related protein 1
MHRAAPPWRIFGPALTGLAAISCGTATVARAEEGAKNDAIRHPSPLAQAEVPQRRAAPARSGGVPYASAQLSREQQAEMVNAHNYWRDLVNVPDLEWSQDVANVAAAWATKIGQAPNCPLQHSTWSERQGTGESLYRASARLRSTGEQDVQQVRPVDVVNRWANEKQYFNEFDNVCMPGRVCGHYTQIVWRKTTQVGCARYVCSDMAQVWVCNYRPPGNYSGQKPY